MLLGFALIRWYSRRNLRAVSGSTRRRPDFLAELRSTNDGRESSIIESSVTGVFLTLIELCCGCICALIFGDARGAGRASEWEVAWKHLEHRNMHPFLGRIEPVQAEAARDSSLYIVFELQLSSTVALGGRREMIDDRTVK